MPETGFLSQKMKKSVQELDLIQSEKEAPNHLKTGNQKKSRSAPFPNPVGKNLLSRYFSDEVQEWNPVSRILIPDWQPYNQELAETDKSEKRQESNCKIELQRKVAFSFIWFDLAKVGQ